MGGIVLNISKNAKPPEILAAHFLQYYFFPNIELIVGDDDKLPDIYKPDKTMGIEVVQCGVESDLDMKYLVKKCKECDSDYHAVMNYANENYAWHNYSACNIDGKAVSFVSHNFLHRTKSLYKAFSDNLYKKYLKLQKENYSGIKGDINLCLVNFHRACGCAELDFIMSCCMELDHKFEKRFNNIYVLFHGWIAVIVNGMIVEKIKVETTIFDMLVDESKKRYLQDDETEI